MWKSINRHIKCTDMIEHLGSEALTGLLVQKYICNSMNSKNDKNKNINN